MKYLYSLILCLAACFLIISCGGDNTPQQAKPKQNKQVKAKPNRKNDPIAKATAKVKLNKAKSDQVRKIENKFQARQSILVKNKKWLGPANKKNRTNWQKAKDQELRKVLGNKLQAYKKALAQFIKARKQQKKKNQANKKKKPANNKGKKNPNKKQ